MRSMIIMFLLTASVAHADNFYPQQGTVTPEIPLPVMPTWWPIWFPTEEPTTPVPEPPTQAELYLLDLERVLEIGEELDDIDAELALQRFLLQLDPNGVNAPAIQMHIMTLEMQRAMLESERDTLRQKMMNRELP